MRRAHGDGAVMVLGNCTNCPSFEAQKWRSKSSPTTKKE
jgi:hypothetical protein